MKFEDVKVGMKVRVNPDPVEAAKLNSGFGGWVYNMDDMCGKVYIVSRKEESNKQIGLQDSKFVFSAANLTPDVVPKKIVKKYHTGQIFKITNQYDSNFMNMLVSIEGKIVLVGLNDGYWWSGKYSPKRDEYFDDLSEEALRVVTGENSKFELAYDSIEDMIAGIPAVMERPQYFVRYKVMRPLEVVSGKTFSSEDEFLTEHPDATIVDMIRVN